MCVLTMASVLWQNVAEGLFCNYGVKQVRLCEMVSGWFTSGYHWQDGGGDPASASMENPYKYCAKSICYVKKIFDLNHFPPIPNQKSLFTHFTLTIVYNTILYHIQYHCIILYNHFYSFAFKYIFAGCGMYLKCFHGVLHSL